MTGEQQGSVTPTRQIPTPSHRTELLEQARREVAQLREQSQRNIAALREIAGGASAPQR